MAVSGSCSGALNILVSQGAFLAVGDQATIEIPIGSGPITGGAANTITINRIRYELDCNANFALGVPCTDQGDIMSYEGDSTIVSSGTSCNGLTWTSNVPAGGGATNEIVFTPSSPITLAANTPTDGTTCAFSFKVRLDNLEPTMGATSDSTPSQVEVVAGYSTALPADTTCDNGLHSGNSTTGFIDICPTCTGDSCTTSVCNTTTGACDTTPLVSSPCADTDGNNCTTAGCEAAPGNPSVGVCVQTHRTQTCTGDDCTSAVCNTTTGQCDFTPLVSQPCADTDGNDCTTAGCEAGGANNHGICVQTHQVQQPCTTTTTTSTQSSTTTTTSAPGGCTSMPATGCRQAAPGASSVRITRGTSDATRGFRWRWRKGAVTDVSDFGDPIAGSDVYHLCVYDASAAPKPLMEMDVPQGGTCNGLPCWPAAGSVGFSYRNRSGIPDGITGMRLTAGVTGKASVQADGKGASLPIPALGLTLPVTVQLVLGTTSECWQTTYPTEIRNSATQFSAKGP